MECFSRGKRQTINKRVLFRMPAGGGALEKNKVREWDRDEGSKRRVRMLHRVSGSDSLVR